MKVVALAGGVGGARFAHGLAQILPAENLTIIVNTGDDFEHFGLKICPDLDTVCYTLAGMENPAMGWGRADESWNAIDTISKLGGPTWFRLGDQDLGAHLERTRRLQSGETLTDITLAFCKAWGVGPTVLPMCDETVPTQVQTRDGWLDFQAYFVYLKCDPQVVGFRFEGIKKTRPTPLVLEALREANLVIICPSNPWVSIDPILSVPGIQSELAAHPVVSVSPIIGGQAVKGPAAKMFAELGIPPSALAVAKHYGALPHGGLLSGFVLDTIDAAQAESISAWGIDAFVTDTLMKTPEDRRRLAGEVLQFCKTLLLQRLGD
jgi:LPPG:FO 2-phospho-L-lactate transferase